MCDNTCQYNNIVQQNNIIKSARQSNDDFDTKYTRKSQFDENKLALYTTPQYYMFLIYYSLVFIILVLAYFTKTRTQFILHLFLTAFLATFPFIAYPTELFLYNVGSYIYAIILGNPYKQSITLFPQYTEINEDDQKPSRTENFLSIFYSTIFSLPLWIVFIVPIGGIAAYFITKK